MEKLTFSISIDAPRGKVWDVLWEDATYRDWTSLFSDGSHAVSDWKEGSEIHFLDGKGAGMYSVIERMDRPEIMSFKHIGEIKNGEEQPVEDAMEWSGYVERYALLEVDGSTELVAETDVTEEFKDFVTEKFPLALARVKELSEESAP